MDRNLDGIEDSLMSQENSKHSAHTLRSLILFLLIPGLLLAFTLATIPWDSAMASDLDENDCLACHSDPGLAKKLADGTSISLYVDSKQKYGSAHRFLDCTTCHTITPHQVKTPLSKLSLAEKCGSCHQYQYKLHLTSVHGEQLRWGNRDVATCTDCHSVDSSPHNVVRVLEPTASTYPKNVAQTCANSRCHGNPALMNKYGIVEKVYESYMRSFHGKAMNLASDKVAVDLLNKATCVNCHGSHDIKFTKNPDGPVAGTANLAKTCEQCHPGAGVTFAAGFLGHKEADPKFLPAVYWGERFFFVFTRIVLGMGILMVLLEVVGWLAGRWIGGGQVAKGEKTSGDHLDG